jgi:hypothetical protein
LRESVTVGPGAVGGLVAVLVVAGGNNPAPVTAPGFAKDELALVMAGQFATSGDIPQASAGLQVATSGFSQTTADIKKCE